MQLAWTQRPVAHPLCETADLAAERESAASWRENFQLGLLALLLEAEIRWAVCALVPQQLAHASAGAPWLLSEPTCERPS